MVREKNAAVKRQSEFKDFLVRQAKELDDATIRFRYAVNEHTPEHDFGDGWSRPIPAKDRRVSEWFDTREEAQAWMDRHEADKGSVLHIIRHRLVQRNYTEWIPY